MSLTVDEIIDRRKLRRRLTFWRIVALLFLVACIVTAGIASGIGSSVSSKSRPHIARISISGIITEDQKMIDLIEKLRKNKKVKGVIVKIDSPGGTTVGGEAIFDAIRSLAEKKPTASSVGGIAASAGYMIASATDHIVARRSSIVGSIGVLFQYPDASKLLDTIGVKVEEVKSSPLKAEPSPFHPAAEETKVILRELIADSYGWFRKLVQERRSLSDEEIDFVATGRVFSGAQGRKNKLVDGIGGENIARDWLVEEKGLELSLKTITWKPKEDALDFLSISSIVSSMMGTTDNTGPLVTQIMQLQKLVRERIYLDGLLSVWHASVPGAIKEGEIH